MCGGKVYVDLAASEKRATAGSVALVRLEELYPFPSEALAQALARYPGVRDVVWLQEEPQNMGAWTFAQGRLQALLEPRGLSLRYVGRPERASPSEGSPAWHTAEQARIVAEAFEGLASEAEPVFADDEPPTSDVPAGASRVSS